MPFAQTWIPLEMIVLSEVSQTEKDMPYDITYMWNLKNNTTVQNRNRLTDVENKLVVTKGERRWDKLGVWD